MLAHIDPYDPEIIRSPWDTDKELLANAPVHFDEKNQIFLVSGYELMNSVLQDTENFSNRYMPKMVGKDPFPPEVMEIYMRGYPMVDALLVTDGEQHKSHRSIINKAFSKARLDELSRLFEERAKELLDKVLPKGRMKFREDVAELVPLIMTQYQLRVSEEDMPRVIQWSRILSSGFSGTFKSLDRLKDEAEQTLQFQEYFANRLREEMKLIEETGNGTRDNDLLTLLAQAMLDPENPMEMMEAISYIFVLLPATHDTTSASMTACMHRFVDTPGMQARAAADPAILRRLIDETMRHESPIRQFWRLAAKDVELGGVHIPAGSWVLLRITAANRDERVFENADSFDPDRRMPRPYLTFSSGIHTCAGRQWALRIIDIVLRKVVESGKTFSFAEGENDFDHEISLLQSPYNELVIDIGDRVLAPT